jgi:beta-mannosidase
MAADLLGSARWECAAAHAGAIEAPDGIAVLDWIEAPVPGTVASALAAAEMDALALDDAIDDRDWWYRTRFDAVNDAPADLELDGLAGYADVWLNGRLVARADDMFLAARTAVPILDGRNELAIRFRSLTAELSGRRPRPRWRVARLAHPQLRWARISLLGRLRGAIPTPPPIGPWRAIRLVRDDDVRVISRRISATTTAGGGGRVTVSAELAGPVSPAPTVELEVAGRAVPMAVESTGEGRWAAHGELGLDAVDRWWPHVSGSQPLYDVAMSIAGARITLGRVGFRDIRVDRTDGGFRFVINGVEVFVGGACWMPVDPIGLQSDRERLLPALHAVVRGNLSMLRVSGDTVYESDAFYDLCDELGILVWQDCMLAFADPPADQDWERLLVDEVRQNLGRLGGRPSIAVVSGGSEIAQQAAYAGIALADGLPLLTELLPAVVSETLGDVPYLPTSPWGGDIPTRPDTGVSHYYGVGAYLREPGDARTAEPRFAAECLAFAVPPRRETVDRAFGGPAVAGHDPRWKRAVFRDAGASWDFEDVRDHYVRRLFDVDPLAVRYVDPDRYLELGRAAVAALTGGTFAEWRRARSSSGGGLVFYLRDAIPGAGMGLIDADGIPKDSWYALRRVLAPVALTVSDEGLNGLVAHVHNATGAALAGSLRVELFVDGELPVDSAEVEVALAARTSAEFAIDGLFDGFRDLSWSHRFGPLTYDVIAATLLDADGRTLSESVHLPGGRARPVERDLGMTAEVVEIDESSADVVLRTRRFAQFVSVDAAGWIPDDTGFDLAPGRTRTVRLERGSAPGGVAGTARALNGGSASFRSVR